VPRLRPLHAIRQAFAVLLAVKIVGSMSEGRTN